MYCKLQSEFFLSSIYGPNEKGAGHKSKRKILGSVTYRTDTEDEINKILLHPSVSDGFGNDFYSRRTASNEQLNKRPSVVSTFSYITILL